jgi:MFS family permease
MAVPRYGPTMDRKHAIVVMAIVSQLAISIVQFGLPALTFALQEDRGFGPVKFGILFGATGVGPALALIAFGRLTDHVGARPVLVLGSLLAGGALAVVGFVHGLWPMTIALLVSGIGAAAVPVAGMTAIIAEFPPDRRGTLLGLRQMAVPAGGLVAAWLLPALHDVGGLELAFAVPAVAVVATGLAFALAVGPTEQVRTAPPSFRRTFSRPLWLVMATGALYVTALGGVLAFTIDAAHSAGFGETAAERLFMVLNVSAASARVVWGMVADGGGGSRRVSTLTFLGLAGAVVALAYPALLHGSPAVAVIGTIALAFGTLGFNGVIYTLAGELGGASAGVAVGAASTVVFFFGSATPPLLGYIAESQGYGVMFAVAAAACLAGALVARRIPDPGLLHRNAAQHQSADVDVDASPVVDDALRVAE